MWLRPSRCPKNGTSLRVCLVIMSSVVLRSSRWWINDAKSLVLVLVGVLFMWNAISQILDTDRFSVI